MTVFRSESAVLNYDTIQTKFSPMDPGVSGSPGNGRVRPDANEDDVTSGLPGIGGHSRWLPPGSDLGERQAPVPVCGVGVSLAVSDGRSEGAADRSCVDAYGGPSRRRAARCGTWARLKTRAGPILARHRAAGGEPLERTSPTVRGLGIENPAAIRV